MEPFGVDQLLRISGSDLFAAAYPRDGRRLAARSARPFRGHLRRTRVFTRPGSLAALRRRQLSARSEEHTSELQSLMRISYAVFCLKKKKTQIILYTVHT